MSSQGLNRLIGALRPWTLAAGLLLVILIGIPGLSPEEMHWLEGVLWLCLAFYALEWVQHVVAWWKNPPPRQSLISFENFVDVLAVIPIPAAHLLGLSSQTAWLLGVFWLLKMPAATAGFSLLHRVVVTEAKSLASVVVLFIFLLFLSAVALHLIERDAQPTAFGTMTSALYWAVTTMTTTGYGDIVPVTTLGRLVTGIAMIGGLAVFGLWTGIIATGFASEARRRDFIRTWEFVARVPFFKPLNPAAIIEIAHMLRAQDVAERTVIVRKGRHGDCMYFIAAGQVEIAGTNPPVRLGGGAFFGELALLGDGVRTATVIATVPTTLLILQQTDYRIFAAHHPDLARAVEEEAARRLAEMRGKPPKLDAPGNSSDLSHEVVTTE